MHAFSKSKGPEPYLLFSRFYFHPLSWFYRTLPFADRIASSITGVVVKHGVDTMVYPKVYLLVYSKKIADQIKDWTLIYLYPTGSVVYTLRYLPLNLNLLT